MLRNHANNEMKWIKSRRRVTWTDTRMMIWNSKYNNRIVREASHTLSVSSTLAPFWIRSRTQSVWFSSEARISAVFLYCEESGCARKYPKSFHRNARYNDESRSRCIGEELEIKQIKHRQLSIPTHRHTNRSIACSHLGLEIWIGPGF